MTTESEIRSLKGLIKTLNAVVRFYEKECHRLQKVVRDQAALIRELEEKSSESEL